MTRSALTTELDLNLFFDEAEDRWKVTGYPIVDGTTDAGDPLFTMLVPTEHDEQCRMDFEQDDWFALDDAPTWLADLLHEHTDY